MPWSPIEKTRDRLAHHYEATDYGLVWDTLVVDLPVIRSYVGSVLNE